MKSKKKGSVKVGGFGLSLFSRLKDNGEAGSFIFLVSGDASLNNCDRNEGRD